MFPLAVSPDARRLVQAVGVRKTRVRPGWWRAAAGLFHTPNRLVVLGEAAFQASLLLEQRRLERSGRPFLLVRVAAPALFDLDKESSSGRRALRVLATLSRQTDTIGWMEAGKVLGVIYTELGGHEESSAGTAILGKIETVVRRHFAPEAIASLEVSLQAYCRSAVHSREVELLRAQAAR